MRHRSLALALLAILLAAGAVGAEDANEALLEATRRSDVAAARAALEAGADVNTKTPYGVTPLMYAADRGSLDIVRLLLERKADVNAKDSFYESNAVMNAAMKEHAEVVRLLLEAGAEGAGDLLTMSASQGLPDLARAILASGRAGPEELSAALVAAKAAGATEVVAALEAAGAKEPEAKPGVALDSSVLARYAGTFKNSSIGIEISFVAEDGKLRGSVPGQPTITYAPSNETTFESVEFPGIKIVFSVVDGASPSLTLEQGGGSYVFERPAAEPAAVATAPVPASPPTAAAPTAEATPRKSVELRPWPSFRGAGATGVADGQDPPATWDVGAGDNVAWKTPIPGLGHSGPVVWGDRVFVTTAVSSAGEVVFRPGLYGDVASVDTEPSHQWKIYALDRKTGAILWERTATEGVPKVKRHTKASHANSTPATDGRHVVAFFGSEGLHCYDVDGKLLWKKEFGTLDSGFFFDPDDQWGFGSSPILYKDSVIVQCDVQRDSFVAAYALADGRELWRTPREEIPSWGSPTVYEGKSRAELITNGTKAVRGYDPATGKELWRLAGNSEITVPTPFVAHDLIFVASGYAPIQPIYAIRPGAQGDITLPAEAESSPSIVWSKKRGGPYMPTPIAYGDHLYTCGNNGVLTCYDARTGEQVYRDRVAGSKSAAFTASPVAADGKLYFTSEEGDVYVVKAGPKYELLATNPVGEVCMATPAIAGGTFFVRGRSHVFAFGKGATDPRTGG